MLTRMIIIIFIDQLDLNNLKLEDLPLPHQKKFKRGFLILKHKHKHKHKHKSINIFFFIILFCHLQICSI
jgi:hypothetical protein